MCWLWRRSFSLLVELCPSENVRCGRWRVLLLLLLLLSPPVAHLGSLPCGRYS